MPYIVNYVDVGEKIKKLMDETNISIEELSHRLNIKKSTLEKILNGKQSFSRQAMTELSSIFNMSDLDFYKTISEDNSSTSIYERLASSSLSELKKYDLNTIADIDIHSKTLIEYLLECKNTEAIKYLIDNKYELIHSYDEAYSIVLLRIIHFMLVHKIKDPMDYIIKYAKKNKSLISDNEIINDVFTEIDKDNVLIQRLFIETFLYNDKAIIKRPQTIVKSDTWIKVIAANHLDNTLDFFIKNAELAGNIKKMIISFSESNYLKGLNLLLDKIDNGVLEIIVNDIDVIEALIKTNSEDIISKYINKGFVQNINVILTIACQKSEFSLVKYLIEKYPSFDYRIVGKAIAFLNKDNILDLFIKSIDQDTLNYLLSVTPTNNKEMILYLINNNAKFTNLYLTTDSVKVANYVIETLQKGDQSND